MVGRRLARDWVLLVALLQTMPSTCRAFSPHLGKWRCLRLRVHPSLLVGLARPRPRISLRTKMMFPGGEGLGR